MQSLSKRRDKKNGVSEFRSFEVFTKISVPFYLFYLSWPTKMSCQTHANS